jgi:hypothetical protein
MTEAEAAPEMPQVEDAEPSPAPEEQTDGEQPSMTPDESKNDSEEAPHD